MKVKATVTNNQNQNKGLFITFEGGEGAGKSTLIDRLSRALTEDGRKVVLTREPGGSELGTHIRHWLLDEDFFIPLVPKAELLLFLADRAQHIEETIKPVIERGDIVLCDRFNDSTIAYQGEGRGLGLDYVQDLCLLACGDPVPDHTFYLDVSPEEGLGRARKSNKAEAASGELDRIESEAIAFHDRVRNGFLTLARQHSERITVLDANESKNEVYEKAHERLLQLSHR